MSGTAKDKSLSNLVKINLLKRRRPAAQIFPSAAQSKCRCVDERRN